MRLKSESKLERAMKEIEEFYRALQEKAIN